VRLEGLGQSKTPMTSSDSEGVETGEISLEVRGSLKMDGKVQRRANDTRSERSGKPSNWI
jgi:hypothetical protein